MQKIAIGILAGFLAGTPGAELAFKPPARSAERLSVWRAPQS